MTKSIRTLKKTFLYVLFSFILIEGCSEDPSPVGSDFFSKANLDSVVVFAHSSTSYRVPITGNSSTLLVGRYQDIEARLLMQFPVPSLPSGVDTSDIVSAGVRLIPRYWFKDSAGTLAFTVHKIKEAWNESMVTFDSTTRTDFYEPSSSGTFSKVMSPHDTITAPIDAALVREWIRDGQSQTHGILLQPTEASTVVYGFTSIYNVFTGVDIRPQLIIWYRPDTTNRVDSVIVRTIQDAFVANAPQPPSDSQFVYLQAGVADRGLFHFSFNGKDSIPRSANIMEAKLTFTRNPLLSIRNELSQDSVSVHLIVENSNPPTLGGSENAKPVHEDSSVFSADIRTIVQQWVTGRRSNYGIALRTFGEFSAVDKFVLYGYGAADSLRPQLRIIYSVLR